MGACLPPPDLTVSASNQTATSHLQVFALCARAGDALRPESACREADRLNRCRYQHEFWFGAGNGTADMMASNIKQPPTPEPRLLPIKVIDKQMQERACFSAGRGPPYRCEKTRDGRPENCMLVAKCRSTWSR